ncbi:hypothetical protein [Nocardioides nematodiphilus]|uniref:hypothetical protein n=1 Tax=Nocardioides nematodiphilus TaxID=2849669 RepID=UPI001CD9A074|nr:hypothetical protein [Nocardioides nematodiphilus]MCA1981795.1 hypothetical protein [Nocardioides nematodiphilus]
MVIPNDGTGSPSAPLRLTSQAAATVKKRFEHASQDLTGHLNGMAGLSGAISEGAGELSGDIEADVLAFLQSWTSAFDVLSTSTALIAGNTNNLAVDLDALDRGSTIDLSGS